MIDDFIEKRIGIEEEDSYVVEFCCEALLEKCEAVIP